MVHTVFDTETTSLEKPFCYNIGYTVKNGLDILLRREYVVEQIWHNAELFSTAYYAEKRPLYVRGMRAHEILMEKYGYITQQMIRDFKGYNVLSGYAYNCMFDEKVFGYNCEWFKCINPFDNIPIFDIRAYAQNFLCSDPKFLDFCEKHERFTENHNYSTTAETVYAYLTNNENFIEAHTALDDALIEGQILDECIKRGAEYATVYPCQYSIPRQVEQTFVVKEQGTKNILFSGKFFNKRFTDNKNTVTLQTTKK